MSTPPRHLLADIHWSFAAEAPESPAEFLEAARRHALALGAEDPAPQLEAELPFFDLLLEYSYRQPTPGGAPEWLIAQLRITNPEDCPLTGAELLWDLHTRSAASLSGDPQAYRFGGLELLRSDSLGLAPPLYRVVWAS